jgi:ubiquinone/menaquinone biosynthesis C-methylase UbiE
MVDTPHVHRTAEEGFSRGAEAYSRGRPDFPPQALTWLATDLGLRAGSTAVEIGAGTGKFTRLLTATGASVIAVEPVAAMLERLVTDLPANAALAALAAVRGQAQCLPIASGSCDAVLCAQSFHWFATPAALAEIRRVLRPGGALGLLWNIRDQSIDWVAKLDQIMAPFEGHAPRYYNGEWRRVFPARGFGSLQETSFAYSHVGAPEQVIVDRVASVSFIAALPAPARERVLREVRALIAATPALAGADTVEFPYVTRAYWCRTN